MASSSVIALELGFGSEAYDKGRDLYALLTENARFTPDFVDMGEPVRSAFPSVDEFVEKWWNMKSRLEGGLSEGVPWPTFLKKKGGHAFTMTVKMPFRNAVGIYVPGRLYFKGRSMSVDRMESLFSGLAGIFEPPFGIGDSFGQDRPEPDMPPDAATDFVEGYFGTAQHLELYEPYRWLTAPTESAIGRELVQLGGEAGPFDIASSGRQVIACAKAKFYADDRNFLSEAFSVAFSGSSLSAKSVRSL